MLVVGENGTAAETHILDIIDELPSIAMALEVVS